MKSPGHLELGDAALQVFAEDAFIERVDGFHGHEGCGHLAPLQVGRGDRVAFEHGGVRGGGALDFDGGNILAAGNDDVLLAVDDVDVVLFVPHGHVAGAQPAVSHHVGGGLGFTEVTVHDVVAAHHDLADGLHVARDVFHLQVHHPDFAAGQGPAGHGAAPEAPGLAHFCHGGCI